MEKSILYPRPGLDQFPSQISWSLAEDLSFNNIWYKSVNNVLSCLGDRHKQTNTDRQTDRQTEVLLTVLLKLDTVLFFRLYAMKLGSKGHYGHLGH